MNSLFAIRKYLGFLFLITIFFQTSIALHAKDKNGEWIEDTNIYEVFVRKFTPEHNLKGVEAHLQDLSDMGVKTIWLMPTFKSPSSHGYDVTDYKSVDPDYGTIDDMKSLVAKAHSLNIKVILDLPINHCGSSNPIFSSPDTSIRKDSWFVWSKTDKGWPKPWQNNNGRLYPDNTWFKDPTGLNRGYYYALFNDFQPDFNYNDPTPREEVYDYFMDVMKFWIGMCDIDGFRCDAVRYLVESGYAKQKDLPLTHEIWQKTRKDLDKIKPSFILLAEAATETDAELLSYYGNGDEFNSGLHFRFPTKLMDTIKNGGRSANFLDSLFIVQDNIPDSERQPQTCVDSLFLNNHDGFVGDRVATQLKGDLLKEKAVASLYILMSGIPVIYYGEEIGLQSLPPSVKYQNRGTYDWSAYETQKADPNSLLSHYTKLLKLRNAYPALSRGDSLFVNAGYCETPDTTSIVWDADTEKSSPILAMLRHIGTNNENSQDALVVHNFSSNPCYIFADLTNFSNLTNYYSGKFFVGKNVVPLMGGEGKSFPDIKADNNALYPLGFFAPLSAKVFLLGKLYDTSYTTYENALLLK